MATPTETPIAPATPAPVDLDAVRAAARAEGAAEVKARAAGIEITLRATKLDPKAPAVKALVDGDKPLAEVRDALLGLAADRDDATPINGSQRAGVEIGKEEIDHVRDGMASYFMHRQFQTPIEGRGNDFRGFSLYDGLRHMLELQGVNTRGKDRMAVAKMGLQTRDATGALGTSHFPLLVAAVTGKSLHRGYNAIPRRYPKFSALRVAPDLKTQRELFVDSAGDLSIVNEFGDYSFTTMVEGQDTWLIIRRGKMIKITPELILADDLNAIAFAPMKLGEASGRTREKTFWTRVEAATAMADGIAVYNTATHGNLLASGAAPSWTQLAAMQTLCDAQTDRSGELITVELDRFAFPAALRGGVAQLWTRIAPTQSTQATPEELFSFGKEVIPYLTSATAYYGFANPELAPAFVHGELEGRQGPTIEDEYDFDSSCLKIKVEDYFGVGAVDYRPTVKNPGA